MNIDISATAVPHGWVVSLDDCRVYFNQLEDAQAFVSRLKARIDAPHPWPQATERKVFALPAPAGAVEAVAG
ncbi:hypothetical protein KKQ10_08435 [Pseudomonas sp. MG-9]|uniref:hypothetical protein n=1 Tax=Pseudomonas sp. MG-9 TaxID=2839032 RepID=UPI001C005704|nr:hypothetical protein [Pseudomonas sp. MG-9]MBT9264902.1 hypothetical protein [Pseudomonas sp. MG-9]